MMAEFVENQHSFDAIFALGTNFFVQGKYEKAEIIFDGLLALDPENLSASLALGEVLMRAGHISRSLDHFLAQSHRFALEGKIWLGAAKACLLLGKYEEAKKLVQPIVLGNIPCASNVSLMAQLIYENVRSF